MYAEVDYSLYDSVWIGTPNNPNGYRVSMSEIRELSLRYADCCFVVDRAYNELSTTAETNLVEELQPNVILIHSLTKTFGVPGIRLGYIISGKSISSELKNLRTPWSVNALSLVVGEFVMDNYSELYINTRELLDESSYLQERVGHIDGFKVVNSQCNFFLCEICGGKTAAQLHEFLVEKYGILIRNCSNFRGLSQYHFRLAAQSREENDILIKALQEWKTTY